MKDDALRDVRCQRCARLLCKATTLRGAGMVEIKCPKCDAFNYVMGRPE